MTDRTPDVDDIAASERLGGDRYFAIAILVISAGLLALIGDQTQWKAGKGLLNQPAFWPGIGLIGMTACAALYLAQSLAARRIAAWDRREFFVWIRCLEYPLWFMAYVFIVPVVGYLPTTVLFCPLLARRAGYRSARALLSAALMGAVIVVLFKALLQVRVPGGALYEVLPDGLRNFMILYL
ncbi:tripartite tricarboxylate transporter TctB family protein [Nitratireductor sp. XY-223]|uniref:tripartite tricarboxylate transporter TctB family protein n=1 Tax=Nitratireductor sp. XY-223 TaxID=2561926 RepID=UPI0010AA864D|nr:tripartite tricarboxylate transporter TctB family protein [Nitratireductor sp. XY-223]